MRFDDFAISSYEMLRNMDISDKLGNNHSLAFRQFRKRRKKILALRHRYNNKFKSTRTRQK